MLAVSLPLFLMLRYAADIALFHAHFNIVIFRRFAITATPLLRFHYAIDARHAAALTLPLLSFSMLPLNTCYAAFRFLRYAAFVLLPPCHAEMPYAF